jgi:small subunit ribosomal protein S9
MAEENRPDDEQRDVTPPAADDAAGEPPAQAGPAAGEPAAEESAPADASPADETAPADPPSTPADEPVVQEPVAEAPPAEPPAEAPPAEPVAEAEEDVEDDDEEDAAPREKPAIPGMDLEVDIVREGESPLRGEGSEYDEDEDEESAAEGGDDDVTTQPIAVEIDLAAGARYRATGKRKTSVARVILRPGTGAYTINGRTLEQHFPRFTLQRNIRQPLETVGYQERMDVVAKIHGGGVSAQAGALRHGISRALIDADPNLRSELKRRGFLTRDSRVKERKKAGLKKARKRPQFSKR